jgi:hypothetical protein
MLDRALLCYGVLIPPKVVQSEQHRAVRGLTSPIATGDWYDPLPFFAKNLPISALVWSRKRCWLFLARAAPVAACGARDR